MYLMIKEWLSKRLTERTTADGAVIIGAGVAYLALAPIAKYVAVAAILYGIWTLAKPEL